MRRMTTSILCTLLVLVLIAPSAAFAGPGNGRGKDKAKDKAPWAFEAGEDEGGPGWAKGRKDKREKPSKLEQGLEGEAGVAFEAGEDEGGPGWAKGRKDKREKPSKLEQGLEGEAGVPGGEPAEEPVADEAEGEGGIAGALSRIQANIAKAEAKVLAGTKKQVPPGLLRVLAKFMGWLGIVPEEPPADDGAVPDDGLPGELPTEPDGSELPTGTVDPDQPVDPEPVQE